MAQPTSTRIFSKSSGKFAPGSRVDPQEQPPGQRALLRAQARQAVAEARGSFVYTVPGPGQEENNLDTGTPAQSEPDGMGCGPGTYFDFELGSCMELPTPGNGNGNGNGNGASSPQNPLLYAALAVAAYMLLG
jgi:hypothetical protein